MMNIDEHGFTGFSGKTCRRSFQETHVAERTCTLEGPLIEDCSKLKLIIYSVPYVTADIIAHQVLLNRVPEQATEDSVRYQIYY